MSDKKLNVPILSINGLDKSKRPLSEVQKNAVHYYLKGINFYNSGLEMMKVGMHIMGELGINPVNYPEHYQELMNAKKKIEELFVKLIDDGESEDPKKESEKIIKGFSDSMAVIIDGIARQEETNAYSMAKVLAKAIKGEFAFVPVSELKKKGVQ